ncbi:hypothetical protein ID866_10651 [Astraeus odoratus]|nr:hypothetical protein ID866_10651 [Astraeus odoratus]
MTSSHSTVFSHASSVHTASHPCSRSATPLSIATSSRSWLSSTRVHEYQEEIARLRSEVEEMQAENEEMKWQRDTAVGHAVVLRRDYNVVKQQLNAKIAQPIKTKAVRHHGLMTSSESHERVAEAEEKRAAKKRKVEEGKQHRQEKAAVVQAEHDSMDGSEVYKGNLTSKNKTELENIALALSFSVEDLKGTKNDLISRIKVHLQDNPILEDNARFSGLYPSHSRVLLGTFPSSSKQPPIVVATTASPHPAVQSVPMQEQGPTFHPIAHLPHAVPQNSSAPLGFSWHHPDAQDQDPVSVYRSVYQNSTSDGRRAL